MSRLQSCIEHLRLITVSTWGFKISLPSAFVQLDLPNSSSLKKTDSSCKANFAGSFKWQLSRTVIKLPHALKEAPPSHASPSLQPPHSTQSVDLSTVVFVSVQCLLYKCVCIEWLNRHPRPMAKPLNHFRFVLYLHPPL